MEENNSNSEHTTTKYIKSKNRGNTFDNMQRFLMEEDALHSNAGKFPLDTNEETSLEDNEAGEREQ
jgi:hypothetical protein